MRYPVAVHHQEGTAYGVTVPDIPGCFSAGDTFDEALANTVEAIEGHLGILAEDKEVIPQASSIEAYQGHPDYADAIWGFVDIDILPFMGKTEKVNVTLPTVVVRRIDAKFKNRSRFLAEAAIRALG